MADHRTGRAGEHCGHAAGMQAEPVGADRVDAAVDAVQAPDPDAVKDRRVPQSDRHQLAARHDPVLLFRKLGDPQVEMCGTLRRAIGGSRPHTRRWRGYSLLCLGNPRHP
jgi:hypothetical protein